MGNLTRPEARRRKQLLEVTSYNVELDLTRGPDVFGSRTTVHFTCTEPGSTTFAELIAGRVHSARLDGRAVEIAGDRITLPGLAAENVLTVDADCTYSHTGEGMHRFTDPADGAVYTYSQTFLHDAQRVLACFDQPDLKAPLTLRVTAPADWIVLSNGEGQQTAPGRWEFARTPPLATYLYAVVAGPYHSATAQHGDLTLGVHCRQSLAAHLEADELLEITGQCFDYYERIFGVPFAFGRKYDQIFVPEFNAGAMENAACVTFTDEMVFRSRVTESARRQRAMVMAHEMAHMWFGDLVTLDWWDDIWLNESFAEYMGFLATDEVTRFSGSWTEFAGKVKEWGYRQDQQPTTHPVSGPVADTDSALLNFDGISYAKGASVLKQLVAWLGFDAFLAGVRSYFAKHAYGNASLPDFLAALEESSGRDLTEWARVWLQTAQVNTLRAEVAEDSAGRYTSAAIVQSAPVDHPTLRPHRLALGLYDREGTKLIRRERVELDVAGARTEVAELADGPVADLLLVNDDDLTWAKVRLDARSLATVLDGAMGRLEDSLPRALLWSAVWDLVRDAELPAGAYLRLVGDSAAAEPVVGVAESLVLHCRAALDIFGAPAARADRLRDVAANWRECLLAATPGGDLQLAFGRAYAGAASSPAETDEVRGWLAGTGVPPRLVLDADLRWLVVRRLAVLGAIDEPAIAAEYDRDTTSAGAQAAATARASLPAPAAKAAAWSALLDSDTLSNHMVTATARGFWFPEQMDLGRPYVEEYFARIPQVWHERTAEIALLLTRLLFPAVLVEPDTLDQVERTLSRGSLDPRLRRQLREQEADLRRALVARQCDSAAR
ncbi:MAG: aminopeptidase N [Actinomycetota bacterium]|nr:aminopeptidase N [Actinomycetota bacterium]